MIMDRSSLATLLLLSVTLPLSADSNQRACVGDWSEDRTLYNGVSLRCVRLGGFLGEHVDANNRRSLLAGLNSPIPRAFAARARGQEPPEECIRLASDSDFYKWLEGACYAITYDPSLKQLRDEVDRYAGYLTQLQEPDGYLGTRISPGYPFDLKVRHDLYVAGHFIEAAVAHYKATGRTDLLNAAVKLADFYRQAMLAGHPYYQIVGRQEHPEIELALVRLHRATGEKRFLEFSEAISRLAKLGPTLADVHAGASARHAVRLSYFLTGLAELYAEAGEQELFAPVPGLWDEIVSTRMYITGGIGYNEVVPLDAFDLPQCLEANPHRDIAETCASVSFMMFSWRLHGILGQSRHFDVIENILYNHYLGAISPDHLGNFYYNPLRRVGDMTGRTDHRANPVRRTRLPAIHSTACCLPNSWRFFAQLPEYVFSRRDHTLLVNLFTDAVLEHELPDKSKVKVTMETGYPHDGEVRIRLSAPAPVRLKLGIRIPGWCEGATLSLGGTPPQAVAPGDYHWIDREWTQDDSVTLHMPMPPVILVSDPRIEANRGQVAFRRGPVVYCLEQEDAPGLDLERAVVLLDMTDPARSVETSFDPTLNMHTLMVKVGELSAAASSALYQPRRTWAPENVRTVRLVPFAFRANREIDPRWITFIPYW